MDAHRVVGRDRAVDEGPARLAPVDLTLLLEGPVLLPEVQDFMLLGDEIDLVRHLFEWHKRLRYIFLAGPQSAQRPVRKTQTLCVLRGEQTFAETLKQKSFVPAQGRRIEIEPPRY